MRPKRSGYKMAGPYYQHKKQIEENGVAVFSSNYHLYGDMSWRVMETLRMLSPSVEVYSVDESFFDLSGIDPTKLNDYALFLKHTTEEMDRHPVSIGVAPTKVLSKVANRLAKKDKQGTRGVMVLRMRSSNGGPAENIRGRSLGYRWSPARKLRLFNINNGWDLRNMSEDWARKTSVAWWAYGSSGELRGEPCIEMKGPLETKKMIATTRMFGKPVFELRELKEAVMPPYITRAAENCAGSMGPAR